MKSLYISRVIIKNYRNFKDIDVRLNHKQVIIGENNIGKTNFLRALQLVLDPSFSDEDRYLEENDFFDGLEDPIENKEIIEIKIYLSNYINNKNILAQLSDATVKENGEEKLLITYRYFPIEKENGEIEYQYIIFKGKDESKRFTHEDRKFINLKVIKALRDVEGEMKNTRTSPVNRLLRSYCIDKNDLKDIAEKLGESGSDVLDLDEIIDLGNNINSRFTSILGMGSDFNVSLKTIDIDPNKLLTSLKILLSDRNTSEISLGLNNILYISLVLLLLQDNTVPTYLKKSKFEELRAKKDGEILDSVYEINDKCNYFIKDSLDVVTKEKLYKFMDTHDPKCDGITILVIEEPEAHLHPTYQRLIYKDVIKNSDNSVLLTTHSTHITSIASIESIVHLHNNKDGGTDINSTTELNLSSDELLDVERYVDVKRGEIYLGKGVILVEGIAEEYLVPRFAELIGKPLDEKGIVVCNVNSTNFKPYVKLLMKLKIPFAVITDGDFYYENVSDKGDVTKKFHVMNDEDDQREFGYLGNSIIENIILDLDIKKSDEIPSAFIEQDELFNDLGFFIGYYTFEVDMMKACAKNAKAKKIICDVFNSLTNGGDRQKENFKNELEKGDYWSCLRKIESNGIGKGRFAQIMSIKCDEKHVPAYMKSAINDIYKKVDEF
ncbi:ATP-dependent nuclease [Clostridium sp. ZS2-4]|uniref:ATP-dependent nuclease n=1 Tax=Clostridium sp. ZS2-4 TaxID=2987703 RepID=UPI00227A67AF|nr:AAA family ATPase [Clostridium sp. ZS2-4]MCY6353635.1 AAA family ATPase [Clostridium sp. ZS2-4]